MKSARLASLAYYYCDLGNDKRNHLRELVSSLLLQLCYQSDSYYDKVSKFYLELANGSRYPSDDALVLCLKRILKLPGQAPVYLIVDALDECPIISDVPSPREKMLTLVKQLLVSQCPNLRICVTSRSEADISAALEPLPFRSISLHNENGHREDIAHYIKYVVNTDPNMQEWRATDKELVIDVLTHKVDGV